MQQLLNNIVQKNRYLMKPSALMIVQEWFHVCVFFFFFSSFSCA